MESNIWNIDTGMKAHILSLGCPLSLCDKRGKSCETTFYVDRCFYNTNKYKTEKPIVKKWF